MVSHLAKLDATFAALADPTRRAILARLAQGEASISDLARPFFMSLPAVLKHVERLRRAGLLQARKEGRVRRCRLEATPLSEATRWIAGCRRMRKERFSALDRYLQETQKKEEEVWQRRTARESSRSASQRRARGPSPRGSTRKP